MKVLRTPESCFENLDDFPFVPNYINIRDSNGTNMRMHYIDEGDPDGEIILCVHGQPVWSYSFRKMVRPLAEAGFRVVVPDLIGFGRSDKPSERSDYSFASHVNWFDEFVIKLNLSDINLLGQDWGGPIGLRVVARDPSKFSRIVATNTGLGDGTGIPAEKISVLRQLLNETPVLSLYEVTAMMKAGGGVRPAFMYWVRHCDAHPKFDPGEVAKLWINGCTDEESRAFSAPFPSEAYLQGARQFPSLVPLIPDDPAIPDNQKAWEVLRTFDRPFLTAFSETDNTAAAARFQMEIPGAHGLSHVTIKDSGHYPQDDAADRLTDILLDFIRNT